MHLNIGNCVIRDWHMDDAPSIARYANNHKVWINLRDMFPHPYGIADATAFISKAIGTRPATCFAIATQSEAIGGIGLTIGEDVHRYTAELGYWLAEPYWGKGIMTRAVESLTVYAIRNLKLQRIFAEPYTTNPASARVLQKVGYRCEGVLRANVYKDGKVLDQFVYSFVQAPKS